MPFSSGAPPGEATEVDLKVSQTSDHIKLLLDQQRITNLHLSEISGEVFKEQDVKHED
jgi:hypothetical protein